MYNSILEHRTRGILLAERQCRQLRMGQVPFSPNLQLLWNTIALLHAICTKKKGGKFSVRCIIALAHGTSIEDHMFQTIDFVRSALHKAQLSCY